MVEFQQLLLEESWPQAAKPLEGRAEASGVLSVLTALDAGLGVPI